MPSPDGIHRDIFGYNYPPQIPTPLSQQTAELIQVGASTTSALETAELVQAHKDGKMLTNHEVLIYPGETIFRVSDESLRSLMSSTNPTEFIRRLSVIPEEKIVVKKENIKITVGLRDLQRYFIKLNIHAQYHPDQWARDEKDVLNKVILGEIGDNNFPDHPSKTAKQIDLVRFFINLLRRRAHDILSYVSPKSQLRMAV